MLHSSKELVIIVHGGMMKMRKFLLVLSLICAAVPALAESPMTTVLHKNRVETAPASSSSVAAMARGFAACDPKTALPKTLLASLGVAFLDDSHARAVVFADANLLKNRSVLLLAGNDPASMETTGDGRFLFYGGKYRLKKSISLGSDINLLSVGEVIFVGKPRARVGVIYAFDKPVMKALDGLESSHSVDLKPMIDRLPKAVTSNEVWVTLGDDGKSATCWRYVD